MKCEDYVPNTNDKEVTKIINETNNLLGIYLIDHVIIGKDLSIEQKTCGKN